MPMSTARRFAVVASVVVIVLVVAACAATPTATPVPPTATPVPATATPVPATATPIPTTATKAPAATTSTGNASAADRELVAAAFTNLSTAQSFGMKVNVSGESSTIPFTGDITMEVSQAPTRSVHIQMGDQLDMIIVGQDVYVKTGASPWQKTPMAASQLQGLQDSLNFAQSVKPEDLARVEINKAGSEKVEGVDSEVYNVTTSMSTPLQVVKVWIAKADKTLVKQELQDSSGTISIAFYGWNTVNVQPPQM